MTDPLQDVLPPPEFGPRAEHVTDARQAEEILARTFVDNRLDLGGGGGPLDARIEGARFGDTTVGRVAYGQRARLTCLEPLRKVHLDLVLAGQAVLTDGLGHRIDAQVGQGAVYMPGTRPDCVLSADCVVLAMCAPPARLDVEVATLLGRRPAEPLTFDFQLRPHDVAGRRLLQVLDLLQAELSETVLGRLESVDRHLETLLLQTLLAAQPHNFSDAMRDQGPATSSVVRRAAELVQADPGRGWTSSGLAAEVHLSVRALQEGFSRELGVAPMPYVRQVRLQRVHDALAHPVPGTTVGGVADRFGFGHLGRFAGHYLERFGERPSVTLARARGEETLRGAGATTPTTSLITPPGDPLPGQADLA